MAITRLWQAGAESNGASSAAGELSSFFYDPAFSADATCPKTGTYAFRISQNTYGIVDFTAIAQLRVGSHWRFNSRSAGGLLKLQSAGGASTIVELKVTSLNAATLYVNAVSKGTWSYTPDTYYHLGIDVKIDGSSGWVYFYVDGVETISFSGNTGTTNIGRFVFGDTYNVGGNYMYADDLFIDNTAGEGSAAAVPDRRFNYITPNGVGNYSQCAPYPGGGESNYQDVDERPKDDDTTYVECDAVDEKDTYAMSTFTIDAGWTIEAIIPVIYVRKSDGGTATQAALMTRYSSVDDEGSAQDLPTTYGYVWDRFTTDPSSNPWTQTSLDGVEIGFAGKGTF